MITAAKQCAANESDFDLLGQVGVRLLNHRPTDVAMVRHQLSLQETSLDREPDIVIRFEDEGEATLLHQVGGDEFGFTEDAFFILRGRRREKVCMRLAVEEVGTRCELVCRRGMSAIPLLESIVKLTAISRGVLPLHAAAFVFRGQGAAVAGFAHGGKTTTLLGFMNGKGKFIGDDTVYVDRDGCIHGEGSAVNLSDRHLAQLPQLRSALPYGKRLSMRVATGLTHSISALVPGFERGRSSWHRGLRKLDQALQGRRSSEITPARLFAREALCTNHTLQRLFLCIAHNSPEIRVESASTDDFVKRLVYVVCEELSELTRCYERFRFAFPDKVNPLLDRLASRIQGVATARLASKALYFVYHPYPVSPQSMFKALSPVF
jgi:hypothetical protein